MNSRNNIAATPTASISVPLASGRHDYELRAQLEQDFAAMALSAVCAKTMTAADITAICPLDALVSPIPRAIYRALIGASQRGPVTLETVWRFVHDSRVSQSAKEEPWPDDLSVRTLSDYIGSIFAMRDDAVLATAMRVREEAQKRRAESKLMGIVSACQQYGSDVAEIGSCVATIAQELETGMGQALPDMSDLMARVVSAVEHGDQGKPLPLPWSSLTRVLRGGLAPGELAVLAARPGMGKTAFAGCVACEMARAGLPVLFISREVKDLTIGNRLVARAGRVDLSSFRTNLGNAAAILPRNKEAAQSLADLPLHVVEKSIAPMTPSEVRRLAKSIPHIGLIVVDYLQLLNPDTRQNSREREVAEMSRCMKQLALDCDCPVLLLSQLNRQIETTDRAPQLSDLRESGAIEQDADIVMFLHTRKCNLSMANMPVEAIVAKGRSSGTGKAMLVFEKPFSDFREDMAGQEWAESFNPQRTASEDNGL